MPQDLDRLGFEDAQTPFVPEGMSQAGMPAEGIQGLPMMMPPPAGVMTQAMPFRMRLAPPTGGVPLQVVSEFKPAGDQPRAIEELTAGLHAGERDQVLLGVTGSGKTFTMAHVI